MRERSLESERDDVDEMAHVWAGRQRQLVERCVCQYARAEEQLPKTAQAPARRTDGSSLSVDAAAWRGHGAYTN